jgi:hypothetical protein
MHFMVRPSKVFDPKRTVEEIPGSWLKAVAFPMRKSRTRLAPAAD